jgi:proton-translocating NADH-quinone oxidoreductase chain L
MLLLIIVIPFLSFLGACFLGFFIGFGACYLTVLGVLFTFIISFILFLNVLSTGVIYKLKLSSWIFSDCLTVDWCFCFDSLTSVMLVVVTFISTLVHIYSIEYMKNDPHQIRFMSYLSLFTFFMIILITSNSFVQLFVGWEGVGLSSYLLINFWFTRIQANKSAIKAMLINKVGDIFLLLAIFCIIFFCDSADFDIVFALSSHLKNLQIQIGSFYFSVIDFICIFLFLGAVGKSAQIGLHSWLPDAMEGPTPVSALIHAATMVTAGIFLIIRCSFLFEYSPNILNFIVVIGAITAFFAASVGLFQNDIKRVIAYSTCSQLGYMTFACGLSLYDVSIFHLSNHAFFKALLFLGAGSIIHALSDEQDMRKMGGLRKILPFSYSITIIGSLALTGFPFLAGFYSKDIILEAAYTTYTITSHFAFYLGIIAAFCTSFYSTRLIFLVFLVKPNGNRNIIINAHEGTWFLTFPLFILSFLSIFVGFLTNDFFIGFGTDFWLNSIFILPKNYILTDIEFLQTFYKILPLIFSILGFICACFFYTNGKKYLFNFKNKLFKSFYFFLSKKWFLDKLVTDFFSLPTLTSGYSYFYNDVDRGLLEKVGPFGIINNLKKNILFIKQLQTGYIYNYLILIIFSVYTLIFLSIYFSLATSFLIFLIFFLIFFYDF